MLPAALHPGHPSLALLMKPQYAHEEGRGSKGAGNKGKDASGPWPYLHQAEKQCWRPPAPLSGAPQELREWTGMELSTGLFIQGVDSQGSKFWLCSIS